MKKKTNIPSATLVGATREVVKSLEQGLPERWYTFEGIIGLMYRSIIHKD